MSEYFKQNPKSPYYLNLILSTIKPNTYSQLVSFDVFDMTKINENTSASNFV